VAGASTTQGVLDPSGDITSRYALDHYFNELWATMSTWKDLWRELADYIMPTRSRFLMSDANKGNRHNSLILDGTAKRALNNAKAGLLAGMASPSRPWFNLSTGDKDKDRNPSVSEWLEDSRNRAMGYMEGANYYGSLGEQLVDEMVFGTGAKIILADPGSKMFRTVTFPIGSYSIAQNSHGIVDTFAREFSQTVRQIVQEYGYDNAPDSVQKDWDNRSYETPYEVRWMIYPNPEANEQRAEVDSRYLPFREVHWISQGGDQHATDVDRWASGAIDSAGQSGVLKVSGFHEFPVSVGRWDKNDDDVFATSCPGMDAKGDIKTLQTQARDLWNAIKKKINPPLKAGPSVRNKPVSMMPGKVNIQNETSNNAGLGSLHETNLDIDHLRQAKAEVRDAVKEHFMEPIFLMLIGDSRSTPPTAEEVRARAREKLSILGPILERQSDDIFDKDIDRIMNILIRRSMPFWALGLEGAPLMQPPEAMGEVALEVEYVSEVAQAQKQVGLAGLEQHVAFVGQLSAIVPQTLDNMDWDEVVRLHAEMSGTPARVTRPYDETAELRAVRAQREAEAAKAEQAAAGAAAAKDLSQADMGGDNALTRLAA